MHPEPHEKPLPENRPAVNPPAKAADKGNSAVQGMVPARKARRTVVERGFMRVVATGGVVGIGVAIGAVLVGQDVAGWIVGLAVSLTTVILAALLWSSRQL